MKLKQKSNREKNNEIKSWFSEKINKAHKPLARMIKKKVYITKSSREIIAIHPTDIKNMGVF